MEYDEAVGVGGVTFSYLLSLASDNSSHRFSSNVHKEDRPSLKGPLGIVGFQRSAGFDEKRHKDLDTVQKTPYIWIRQRPSPYFILPLTRFITVY